jgi:acetyltransferase-like isoleucine patch superfamily enzyme
MTSLRAYVVAASDVIAPFDVSADDVPIGAGTLGDARLASLRAVGAQAPIVVGADHEVRGPCLVMSADLWASPRAMRSFVALARKETAPVRLRLPASRLTELTLPLQDVDVDDVGPVFACAYVQSGAVGVAGALLARARPMTIAYRELLPVVPVPRALLSVESGQMTWPLTSTVVMRIRHWVHVLRASHVAPQVLLLEAALASPLRSAWRVLLGLRPGAAQREAAWRRQFVFVGRRTLIHPSAVVEGSIVGDDVVIGPGAVVINSVIGAGARLEQRTHLSQSTLGPRTFMSLNSSMQACVTFADADACANNLQACVIGAHAGLTSFARALDTTLGPDGRPGGPVFVDDGERRRDAGPLPCGVAFGPRSYVGAGVTVAAGRSVGAGIRIVEGAGATVKSLRGAVPGTWQVGADGRLSPLPRPGVV